MCTPCFKYTTLSLCNPLFVAMCAQLNGQCTKSKWRPQVDHIITGTCGVYMYTARNQACYGQTTLSTAHWCNNIFANANMSIIRLNFCRWNCRIYTVHCVSIQSNPVWLYVHHVVASLQGFSVLGEILCLCNCTISTDTIRCESVPLLHTNVTIEYKVVVVGIINGWNVTME